MHACISVCRPGSVRGARPGALCVLLCACVYSASASSWQLHCCCVLLGPACTRPCAHEHSACCAALQARTTHLPCSLAAADGPSTPAPFVPPTMHHLQRTRLRPRHPGHMSLHARLHCRRHGCTRGRSCWAAAAPLAATRLAERWLRCCSQCAHSSCCAGSTLHWLAPRGLLMTQRQCAAG